MVQHDQSMAVQATASDSVQEGLQREDGWGPLKEGRQTWFIRSYDLYLRSSYPSLLDDKRKERDWKRMETGDYQFAYTGRVNDDKHEQASKRQGCD